MEYFNPIQALIEGTGALINSSKKRFTWRFELDSAEHSIELECSFITNKRRVSFDGTLVFKGSKAIGRDFQYRFQHDKHIITIENHRTDANLLVDSMSFDEIYTKRIWKRSFDHKPAQPAPENIVDPRPAKYISEEEYVSKSTLSEGPGGKKSLHEILHKNNDRPKANLKIAEDFLEIGEEEEKKKKKKNEDLLGFDEVPEKDLLDIHEPKGTKPLSNDFLNEIPLISYNSADVQNIDLLGDHSVSPNLLSNSPPYKSEDLFFTPVPANYIQKAPVVNKDFDNLFSEI